MNLTMCGLLVERSEELARLYAEHGNWNDVKKIWFDERLSNRSTRGSSRKIYRVLTSRFKNAPTALPNPSTLPTIFDESKTARDKAQILYLYLIANDSLVRYVVHEYAARVVQGDQNPLDFSNETLMQALNELQYSDGSVFDYAESTTGRWCEGLRSVMREIGVLENQQKVVGDPPSLGDTSLLVAVGCSYEEGEQDWFESPTGLQYLFQPSGRWEELYNRATETGAWKFVELHGSLQLRPTDEPYSSITSGGT